MTPPFRPLTPEETASLYAEMQRPSPQGYADELPEERGWFARLVAIVKGVPLP